MVLALLPFEKAFYDKHQVPCTFVGHPLADDIPMESDKELCKSKDSIYHEDRKILALMPGSRGGELSRILPDFFESAKQLQAQDSGLLFIAPMISEKRVEQFHAIKR